MYIYIYICIYIYIYIGMYQVISNTEGIKFHTFPSFIIQYLFHEADNLQNIACGRGSI